MIEKKIPKKQPEWKFTRSRREALKAAQRTHVILVAIGKEYRNKAIKRAKYRRLLGKGGKGA
jgi:hypothetical protein